MDITVFENSVRNYFLTKYGVVYTSGINVTQIPDGDMFIYSCKLSLNNNDKPLAITGQYPDLDSFLLSVYKEIDSRRFYTTEYFGLRNVEELSKYKAAAITPKENVPCVSTVDTVGDIFLKVLERIAPQITSLQAQINLLSSTLDDVSTTVNSQALKVFEEAIVNLDGNIIFKEIGSSNNINITGNIEQNNDTEIVSSIVDYGTGNITLPNTFSEIDVIDTDVTSDRIYTAKVTVKRKNLLKTLKSNQLRITFVYPFLYGTVSDILADADIYSSLIKDISGLSNKSYILNGSNRYIYILIPNEYPFPKSILQNGMNVVYSFIELGALVSSNGLLSDWTHNYKILRTEDKTSVNNQEFILNF